MYVYEDLVLSLFFAERMAQVQVGDEFFSCFGAVDDDRSKSKPRQNSKKTYNGPTTLSMQVPCLQTNNDMTNGRRDIVDYLSIAFVLVRVCILRKNQTTFLVRELSLYGPLAAMSVINTLSEMDKRCGTD